MFQLYNNDCLNILKQLPDKSIDLLVTDPPYDVHAGKGGGTFGNRKSFTDILNISDGFSEAALDELVRVMKKINCYFFCSQKQILWLTNYFVTQHNCNWNLLSWHKSNPVPTCNNKYLNDTEYILYFRESGVPIYGKYETKKTYYVTATNKEDKKLYNHPTVKPLDIVTNLVINSSNEGDLVLDCYLGSGTTGVACLNTNRDFIGIEIDKEYFEIAKQRIEKCQCI